MDGKSWTRGHPMRGGLVSGDVVTFLGDAMSPVVRGIEEVRAAIGQPPVVVGGLAVLARLSRPYRATVDLDVVDRLRRVRHLELLREAEGAIPVEPSAVLLDTPFGSVKVDVLEVRQVEIDVPSDDPGDRLHAVSHAWAYGTATELTLEVLPLNGDMVRVTTLVAEPGPLVAMKLQAVMNRSRDKHLGTNKAQICWISSGWSLTKRLESEPSIKLPALVVTLPKTFRSTSTCGSSDIEVGRFDGFTTLVEATLRQMMLNSLPSS